MFCAAPLVGHGNNDDDMARLDYLNGTYYLDRRRIDPVFQHTCLLQSNRTAGLIRLLGLDMFSAGKPIPGSPDGLPRNVPAMSTLQQAHDYSKYIGNAAGYQE